jgi:hypothetical protein
MLSYLLLIVAGVTAVACIQAAASIPAVAGVPLDPYVLTVAGHHCYWDLPGVVSIPAVAFVPALAGVLLLAFLLFLEFLLLLTPCCSPQMARSLLHSARYKTHKIIQL